MGLGGRMVYAGPASGAVAHFASSGFECPLYANPADFFFMHVLADGSSGSSSADRHIQLHRAWDASFAKQAHDQAWGRHTMIQKESDLDSVCALRYAAAPWLQFQVLMRRGLNDIKRNRMRGKAQAMQAIALGIIITVLWFRVTNDQNGVQDRQGVLFFMSLNTMMMACLGAQFFQQRTWSSFT